ncbi:MAG: phospholipase D-like domain-containing protein [Bacteroidales bacterium]|jgi:cardiolipin synthase|nr:phospholipase D-like domain-containing protein [Bacteroidales bacterium]
MKRSSKHGYSDGHSVELLRSGGQFFKANIEAIDSAVNYIHFQTYIVDEDETGTRIFDALIRAAGRGVRTYLLLDAFGTKYLSGELVKRIEDSGILFRFFSPVFITKGFQLSLRLHHKVLLVDGELAIIGGLNFANRYHGKPGKKEWLDFAVMVKGPECIHINTILKRTWNKTFLSRTERSNETVPVAKRYDENITLRVTENNWYRNRIEILRSYRAAFKHSHHHMIIFASYFLPGRLERKLLRLAGARGVDIKIVLAAESDAPIFKRATSFLYEFILRNNIRIYEYLPSNLHAKVATVDGRWCTIGSYNLNHISDYGSIEMNVEILDSHFTAKFEKILLEIIKNDCRQVTFEEYLRRRTIFSRFTGWLSYQMIRLLMRVMAQMTSKKGRVV